MSDQRKRIWSVVSLILGVISLVAGFIITAIPGVITGHMARARIRNFPERYTGDGMAITGLILNYFVLIVCFLMMLVALSWYVSGGWDNVSAQLNEVFEAYQQVVEGT